jgi:dTDP-4-dehydrorhamnose reductase
MKLLVTGATGKLGTKIVEAVLKCVLASQLAGVPDFLNTESKRRNAIA